jgi:Domain of unknown function (DUF4491)
VNRIGLVAAATAFFGIWLGHVSVRKIESAAPALGLPTAAFLGAGILLEWLSARSGHLAVSAAAGILGITMIWDAVELWRQQGRVWKGHAPANPSNPRHARMLAQAGSHATTHDLLKREPLRRPARLEDGAQGVSGEAGPASSTRATGP